MNMLMRLKNAGAVTSFDMIGSQKARVRLRSQELVIISMSNDYVVGNTSIIEAVGSEPYPEYIVYNDWDKVTDSALEQAQKLNIPLIRFGRLRYLLDERLAKQN